MYTPASLFSRKRPRTPFFIFVALTLSLLGFFFLPSVYAAELQSIDTVFTDHSSQVVLKLNEAAHYKLHTLPADNKNPNRCYVDLYSTNRSQSLPSWIAIERANLTKIRTGIHATTLRVVLDLKSNSKCEISTAPNPFKIIISVVTPKTTNNPQTNISQTELDEKFQSLSKTTQQAKTKNNIASKETHKEPFPNKETTELTLFDDTTEKQHVEMWGWLKLFTAHDINKKNSEDTTFSHLRSKIGADWATDLPAQYSLQLRGSLDLQHFFYQQDMADNDTELRFDETFVKINSNSWDATLGNQRVRWGKTDQISPIDTINPQDFRQFITRDREDRAIPSWMLRNRWYSDFVNIETIVQPWFQASEIDYFDSDWALFRNFRKKIISNPLSNEMLNNYIRSMNVQEEKPSHSLKNISAAMRLSWQAGETDYAVSYNYGWETLPTITSFPIKNINYSGNPDDNPLEGLTPADFTNEPVMAEFKRQQTLGFEWETVIDPVGFRGEIAYKDGVSFISQDFTSERSAVTQLVSGIDYTSESEWYFNLQGSLYYIHDYNDNILYYDKSTVSVFGEIRKPILHGNLELSTKYNYIVTDGSSYLQPAVKIKYFQNVECELGAMIFSGDGDSLLGSYDEADQIYATLKFSF